MKVTAVVTIDVPETATAQQIEAMLASGLDRDWVLPSGTYPGKLLAAKIYHSGQYKMGQAVT